MDARSDGPPLRLVAVGCGRVFERFHLPALQRSAEWALAGAVDRTAERLRWVGRVAPDAALGTSLGELPATPGADAVLICSPPDSHCTIASEALRRGLHVLIEKPMVLRTDEAASLLQLARAAGRQIWVGYNRRFRPAYLRLRERIRTLPPERLREIVYELRTDPRQWGALSGGVGLLDDVASHQLDLVPWLAGRPVEAVRAHLVRGYPGEAAVAIDLRFPGGVLGRCRAAQSGGAAERLEVRLADHTILADQGALASAGLVPAPLVEGYLRGRRLAGSAVRRLRGLPEYGLETFGRQLAAWAAALRGREAVGAADGAAGARSVELIETCRQSLAVGGEWIPLPAPATPA